MLGQIHNATSKIQNPPGTWHLTPDTCSLPRFVVTLEAPAESVGLLRVPLAVTGKWVRGSTTFAITRQDLEDIVRNFRERQNGEINVDYDHASEMPEVAAGGPVPSAGRIVRLDPPEPATGLGTRDSGFGPSSAGSASRESRVASRESPINFHPRQPACDVLRIVRAALDPRRLGIVVRRAGIPATKHFLEF